MDSDINYNELPITYCRDCLWIGRVESVMVNGVHKEFCPHCGCTSFKSISADKWDELFRFKYKRPSFYKCKESWSEIINDGTSKEEAELMNLLNI